MADWLVVYLVILVVCCAVFGLHQHGNRLMNALLFWVSGYLRCRIIKDSGEGRRGQPYLERYWLGHIPFTKRHAYLHRFLASDSSQLHDHPWRWALSLIICGWYWEDRRWGRGAVRWFNWLTGESFHRVELPPRGTYVWTIFIVGPRCKTWGMMEHFGGAPLDEAFIWERYEYGAEGNNEDAFKARWYETYPRGRQTNRERRDYVRSK